MQHERSGVWGRFTARRGRATDSRRRGVSRAGHSGSWSRRTARRARWREAGLGRSGRWRRPSRRARLAGGQGRGCACPCGVRSPAGRHSCRAAVLVCRALLYGPAAVRRLACGLGPAPPFGGPLRDEGGLGSGEPAQGGGLPGERLIVPALGCALEDAGHLGQQVGPACGKVAEFSHRGGLLVRGEVAPPGVMPGGSGELGDQKRVSSRHETILIHRTRIERASGYLKQAGGLSRQPRSKVAVGSGIPGQLPGLHPHRASSRVSA